MNPWRWAALFALLMIGIALLFARIDGIAACDIDGDPIIAFELTGSPRAAEQLFPPPCRAAELSAQRQALRLDTLAFIPAYGLFLILTLAALASERSTRTKVLVRRFAAIVVLALIADWWENGQLMTLIERFPGDQALFDRLYLAPRAKFALLGLSTTMAGVLLMRSAGWRRLAGFFVAVAGAWTGALVVFASHKATYPLAAAWIVLAATALALALRRPAATPA